MKTLPIILIISILVLFLLVCLPACASITTPAWVIVNENNGDFNVTLSRYNTTINDTIYYETVNINCSNQDYIGVHGYLTIPIGESQGNITIFVRNNNLYSGNRSFNLSYEHGQANTTIYIVDDDRQDTLLHISDLGLLSGVGLKIYNTQGEYEGRYNTTDDIWLN